MNNREEVTRRELRNGMKDQIREVRMLADKTRSKHRVVCDVLKELESNGAGLLTKRDLEESLTSIPQLSNLRLSQLSKLVDSVFSSKKKTKLDRNELRAALESRIPMIDKLEDCQLPRQEAVSLVSKIMTNLESEDYEGMITAQDLIQVVTEQATAYDTDVDMQKVKKLAHKVMKGKLSRKRDHVRMALEKSGIDLIDAVLQLDDDHLIVCEVMKALELSKDGLIGSKTIKSALSTVAFKYQIEPDQLCSIIDELYIPDTKVYTRDLLR